MVLSAKNESEDMKYGFEHGADFYVTKPFQPERLFKNVEIAFRNNPPIQTSKKHSLSDSKRHIDLIEKRQSDFLAEQERKKQEDRIAAENAKLKKIEEEKLALEKARQEKEAQALREKESHTAMHNIVEEEYDFIEHEAEELGHPEEKVVDPKNEIPSVRGLKKRTRQSPKTTRNQ